MLDVPLAQTGPMFMSGSQFTNFYRANGVTKAGFLPTICVAAPCDKPKVIDVINKVAGERRYLHTYRYQPTLVWEQLFDVGVYDGGILLVVEVGQEIIGFGRLTAVSSTIANFSEASIGLALLPAYRSQGIGSTVLAYLLHWAKEQSVAKVRAVILADNEHSRNLFAKFEFITRCHRDVKLSFRKNVVKEVIVELNMAKEGLLCQ